MQCTKFVLVLLVLQTGPTTLAGDAPKSDDDKIQGTWQPKGLSLSGKPLPKPAPKDLPTRTFTKTKLVTEDPGKGQEEATYKLEATKKPKQIDITSKRSKKTLKGIYVLDGDTLKIAYYIGGEVRPEKLDGDGVFVETLARRIKK
jgi:uncharacterized protein (TIGR03067 family)